MIDPDKLPAEAIEAGRGVREFGLRCSELGGGMYDFIFSDDLPQVIAAFLTRWMEDDEAMLALRREIRIDPPSGVGWSDAVKLVQVRNALRTVLQEKS